MKWHSPSSMDSILGEEGPPFPFSLPDLTALFAEGYEVLDDYEPDVAFPGREGRERIRVMRRTR